MKGTGVVQGLKSFAAKIHPQLPLNAKESNRLLTALTSSFRKHLDEAHPTAARPRTENDKDTISRHGGVAKCRPHGIHSSAIYADRHLASVLTNPLLAKGGLRLDYASAKRELVENPAKDPIQLLEEYHEKNAATVRIAELCLENFHSGLTNMSAEARKAYILKSEPGRRVFLWLLQNKLYDALDYVDNLRFQTLLVYFIVQEDREENIWDWMSLDMTIASSPEPSRSPIKQALYRYRWRGRLLRSLVEVKLGHLEPGAQLYTTDDRLHDALDAFFKACDLKVSGRRRKDHLEWIPLGASAVSLSKEIQQRPRRTTMCVDRYERFRKSVPLFLEGAPTIFFLDQYASLDLHHPRQRSAEQALQFWRELVSDNPASGTSEKLSQIKNSPGLSFRFFNALAGAIFVLQNEGRAEEVSWLIDKALPLFPKISPRLRTKLHELAAIEGRATMRPRHDEAPVLVPFPTLA